MTKLPQGFTRDGKQVLPHFLQVTGNFETTCGHLLSPQTLFVHLYSKSIGSTFHAGIIQQSLTNYFPNGGLDNFSVEFVFGTAEVVEEYALHAKRVVQEFDMGYDRVVMVLTDHSDDDTGDLWIGEDESGIMVAAPADQVSDRIFALFFNADVTCRSSATSLHLSRRLYMAVYFILLPVVLLSTTRRASKGFAVPSPSKYS